MTLYCSSRQEPRVDQSRPMSLSAEPLTTMSSLRRQGKLQTGSVALSTGLRRSLLGQLGLAGGTFPRRRKKCVGAFDCCRARSARVLHPSNRFAKGPYRRRCLQAAESDEVSVGRGILGRWNIREQFVTTAFCSEETTFLHLVETLSGVSIERRSPIRPGTHRRLLQCSSLSVDMMRLARY